MSKKRVAGTLGLIAGLGVILTIGKIAYDYFADKAEYYPAETSQSISAPGTPLSSEYEETQQEQTAPIQSQAQEQGPIIYSIREWANCGNFDFRVTKFYAFRCMEHELWNIATGENVSEETFYRNARRDVDYKFNVVRLNVYGVSDEPQTFDFWKGVTLYNTAGATFEAEGIGMGFESYQFKALWKILNENASRYADVTRSTSVTRDVPFPTGASGIYRLGLEGKFNGEDRAFIELGQEPEGYGN